MKAEQAFQQALALSRKYTQDSMQGAGAIKGEDGFSPTITESPDNSDTEYRLNITNKNGTFSTPNLKGPKGDTGQTGAQGIRGDRGQQGEQGVQGIQGNQGPKGDDGYPFLIYKEYATLSDFNAADFPEIGLMFMVKEKENGAFPVYRFTGAGEEPYSFVTGLSDGEGIKGDKGDPGEQGPQGVPGKDGNDGTTYTPTIGNVVSGETAAASVDLDEEEKTAKFNFVLPENVGGGASDYSQLSGKPQINNVTLNGNKTLQELGINNFSGNYDDLSNKPSIPVVPSALPNPYPISFGGMLVNQTYNGSQAVTVQFPDAQISNESAGTPVGEIISYMGTSAPPNYLVCDGSVYNIADYQQLADHIKNHFTRYNFFGGNGTTTFAVPDLRGEFLRGSGTNGHSGQGNGANVGVHQDGTRHVRILKSNNSWTIIATYGNPSQQDDIDMAISSGKGATISSTQSQSGSDISSQYTSRPTNTSVLYCIKCRPTYFATIGHTYSYQERRVGTWVDGKPLYEKTINFGGMSNAAERAVPHGISNVNKIWVHDGYVYYAPDKTFYGISFPSFGANKGTYYFFVGTSNVTCVTDIDRRAETAIVVLRYTKTTD